jgi:rubrerythrin
MEIKFSGLLKEALEFILKKEREHLSFFEKELFRLRQVTEDGFEEDDLLNYFDYGIFEPYRSIDQLSAGLTNIKKALNLAITVESKSIAFYSSCRDKVLQEKTKKTLSDIIEEEKKHKLLFEDMIKEV